MDYCYLSVKGQNPLTIKKNTNHRVLLQVFASKPHLQRSSLDVRQVLQPVPKRKNTKLNIQANSQMTCPEIQVINFSEPNEFAQSPSNIFPKPMEPSRSPIPIKKLVALQKAAGACLRNQSLKTKANMMKHRQFHQVLETSTLDKKKLPQLQHKNELTLSQSISEIPTQSSFIGTTRPYPALQSNYCICSSIAKEGYAQRWARMHFDINKIYNLQKEEREKQQLTSSFLKQLSNTDCLKKEKMLRVKFGKLPRIFFNKSKH